MKCSTITFGWNVPVTTYFWPHSVSACTLFRALSHTHTNLFSACLSISSTLLPATLWWPQESFINMDYMSTGTKPGRKPAGTDLSLARSLSEPIHHQRPDTEIEIKGKKDREREKRKRSVWELKKDWPSLAFSWFIIQKALGLISYLCSRWAINNCAVKVKQRPSLLIWWRSEERKGKRTGRVTLSLCSNTASLLAQQIKCPKSDNWEMHIPSGPG